MIKVSMDWSWKDESGHYESDIDTSLYGDQSDEEIIECIEYSWTEGNFSCDCNKLITFGFEDKYDVFQCGDEIIITNLKVVKSST